MPARLQADHIAGNLMISEIARRRLNFFRIPFVVAAVQQSQRPFRHLRPAASKHIILTDDLRSGIALDHIHVHACGNRNPHAHDQIRILADGIEFRFAASRTAVGMRRHRAGVLLFAAIEFRISGGIEIHAIALIGYEKRNGRVGFAVGRNGICIHVQPQLAPPMVKLLQLKAKAEDMAVILNGKFQHAARGDFFESKAGGRIGYVRFHIVEAVAKPGGNQLFRCAEGEFFHCVVSFCLLACRCSGVSMIQLVTAAFMPPPYARQHCLHLL